MELSAPAHADGPRILAKVSSAAGETIRLDKGSAHGVKRDMLFDIYRDAKVVYVPMTKEKVFVEEKAVGQAIVTSVAAASCTCKTLKLEHGMKVRVGDTAVNVNPKLAPDVNAPPVIESMSASRTQAYAGEEVTVNCEIYDGNDNFHIFSWSCDAGQLSAQETVTGTLRWLCPPERAQITLTVTVTDPHGAQAKHSIRIKALGPGPRGRRFRPTASFGEITPRFRKIAFATFDSDNHLLILDALEKKLITLSEDFNILRVSALYGEEFSFSLVKVHGSHIYAVDSRSGSLNRYKYQGDIFRRKPEVIYGARGSGNGYFGNIADLEVAANGDVYILDNSACAIHIFSPTGQFVCSIGRRGNKPGEMRLPTAIAMDMEGNFYVSDYARRKILKFGADNQFVGEYDLNGKLAPPKGLRYSRRFNNLVILERSPHGVCVMSTAGRLVRRFKRPTNALGVLADPEQLAVSHTGEVFVVSENGDVLRRYSQGGDFLGKMGGENLANVSSFTVTPEGGLYLLDTRTAEIWHIDRNGWTKSRFGGRGPNPGQFQAPIALCSDTEGNAYVLDSKLNRVFKFSPSGNFLKPIGNPGSGKDNIDRPLDLYSTGNRIYLLQYRSRWSVHVYSPDGRLLQLFPDKEAETSRPAQIAVDKNGNSFIFTKGYQVEFFDREGAKRSGARKTRVWLDDLAVDIRGDIYGTVPDGREILRIDPTRRGAQWMLSSTRAARNCAGIGFDRYGRMYLFDKYTKVVVRLSEDMR